jgi:hypothetical protein
MRGYYHRSDEHKAKQKARSRKAKVTRPDHYRKLNRESAARMRAYDPERFRETNLRFRQNHPERYLVQHARNRARRLGVPFDLTEADIIVPAICPVLGIPLFWGVGKQASRAHNSPSLDRLDPSKGYTRENVRIISNRANHLKNNGTAAELRAIADYIDRELGRR